MPEKKEVRNVYQRVLSVMNEVSYIKKTDDKVNGQYKFVTHDSVVGSLNKAFVKHGLCVIPSIDEMTVEGNRTEIKLIVAFFNADDPKDQFSVYSYGHGIDKGDKGIGKAYSYAYKYALLKTFALETGDQDPELQPDSEFVKTKKDVKDMVTLEEKYEFIKTCKNQDLVNRCLERLGAETVADIPADRIGDVYNFLKEKE